MNAIHGSNIGSPARAARWAARAVLTLSFLQLLAFPLVAQDTTLAFRRAQALRHGINLSHWFAQVYDSKG